jgi:Rhodococcus equi virulence-associated protein
MGNDVPINAGTMAADFQTATTGKLEDDKIAAAVAALNAQSATTGYPANADVASALFYLRFECKVKGGKKFEGNAGGLASVGGGVSAGALFTDNLDKVYRDTKSFMYLGNNFYFSLYFFDRGSNLLGTFQGAALSFVAGTGGGTGSWS